MQTLSDLISYQATKFKNQRLLNFKENGKWISFSSQEFLEKSFYFACGLREIGFVKGQTFAIFAYQNPLWLIADYGAILAGGITVPIFYNISKENLLFEIKDADVKFIFADQNILPHEEALKSLAVKIISYNIENKNYISLEDLILLGKKAAEARKYNLESFIKSAKEDELATIIYTSGSTGTPKGVELTHKNLISQIIATKEVFPLNSNSDKVLSFLPLAHVFERMVMSFYITQGIEIYFVDDVKKLGNFLQEVQPTLMTVVPRMLEKIFAKIKEGVDCANFAKKFIGQKAVQYAFLNHENQASSCKNKIIRKLFDVLVYKKFRHAMGGKMRMVICGGAALSQELELFYNNIGINLYCGYGLTETSPVLATNCPKAHKLGTIGKKFPGVELRIIDDGELLARGANVMRGYHNQPQKTAETIIEGWIRTGDLAQIDNEGFVKIIGRKKELFKTANGKYVSPVPIEQKLMQELGFLSGVVIVAEGKKFVSALLFPEFDLLKNFKAKLNCQERNNEEFLQSTNLQTFIEAGIAKVNAGLDHAEKVQKFAIISTPISTQNGEITPSMKLKRNVIEEKFKNVIEGFYKD